jgi:ribosomal protein L3
MLPLWDKWGERHAVTVLHLDDVVVVQSKTIGITNNSNIIAI